MNCRRIEEMIPLYVEGDLEIDRAELVSAHLKSCVACSRLAGGFNDSQEWLRSYAPPAFDSTFFDGLRNGVLAQIEGDKARPSFFQLISSRWRWDAALAAALLLVILSGLAVYTYQRGFTAPEKKIVVLPPEPREAPAPQKDTAPLTNGEPQQIARTPQPRHRTLRDAVSEAVVPAQPESVIGDLLPDLGIPLPNESDIESASVSQGDPGQVETQTSVKLSPPANESMTRIEIQTSDPAIRIIWFAPNNVAGNSGRFSRDS